MPEQFDPYYTWLGIPPDEQPANHYRLLGVRAFEENADVIENGADQRMTHLRTFQTGKRAKYSEDILNKVAAAKVCLLSPQKKAAYDEQLREELGEGRKGEPEEKKLPQAQPLKAPPVRSKPLAPAAVRGAGPEISVEEPAKPEKPRVTIEPIRLLAAGGGAVVILLLALIIWSFTSGGSDKDLGKLVFQWPEKQREQAILVVDGDAVSVPPTGECVHSCSAGTHEILVARPGFQDITKKVEVAAGESETVEILFTPRAMLILQWGRNEGRTSPIEIDGRVQRASIVADTTETEVRLVVEPGEHTLRIRRPGFEPFERAFTIAGRTPVTIATNWKPVFRAPVFRAPVFRAPVEPAPESPFGEPPVVEPPVTEPPAVEPPVVPPPVVEPPPAVVKRRPVPSRSDQERIAKEVDELYQVSKAKTPADMAELAKEMLKLGHESDGDPTEQFTVLRRTAELAAKGGDAHVMVEAIDVMGANFDIDTLGVKSTFMTALAKTAKSEASFRSLVASISPLVDRAMAEHRYKEAYEMVDAAYRASLGRGGQQFRKELYQQRSAITGKYKQWQEFKKSLDSLATAPDDPAANLAVGQWYCFVEGNWKKGLPALIKSNDPKLQPLAQKDLAGAGDSDAQMGIGDAWWSLSQSEEAESRSPMMQRAAHWYRQAFPQVQSVLTRSKINQRLERVAELTAPAESGSAPTAPGTPSGQPLPKGQWVDILKGVDGARGKDGLQGPWTRDGSDVKTSRASPSYSTDSLCMLPVHVEGNYDMQMEFTRTGGDDTVFMVLPVGIQQVAVALSCKHGAACGLDLIGGRNAAGNPSTVKTGMVKNGKRHIVQANVQLQGKMVSIRVSLDGKRLISWKGLQSLCGISRSARIPDLHRPGVGARDSEVTFHAVKLRVAAGEGHLIPSGRRKLPFALVKGTGSGSGAYFIDLAPEGGHLAGFQVAQTTSGISHIQPIYKPQKGPLVPGGAYGPLTTIMPKTRSDTARNGYAVGAVTAKAVSYRVYGFRSIFFADKGDTLDGSDQYKGNWLSISPEGAGEAITFNSGGRPIVGVYGSYGSGLASIGLVVANSAEAPAGVNVVSPPEKSVASPRPRPPVARTRPAPRGKPGGKRPGMSEEEREKRKAMMRKYMQGRKGGR